MKIYKMDFASAYQILFNMLKSLPKEAEEAAFGAFEEIIADYRKKVTEIRRQKQIYRTILETVREISLKALDTPRFEQYIINTLRGQFGVVNVLFLRQEEYLDPVFAVHTPRLLNPPDIKIPIDSIFTTEIAKFGDERQALLIDKLPKSLIDDPNVEKLKKLGIKIVVPLIKKDEQGAITLHGMIGIGPRAGGLEFNQDDIEMLLLLGSMVGVTLHNAHLYHRSIIDNLTRVYSRGYFDIQLEQEIDRTNRENEKRKAKKQKLQGLTLLLVDLDDFKVINDTYGHQAGDLVLYEIAQVMRNAVRKMDLVCRYGGEEFCIIFPDSNYEVAPLIAERIRKAVENKRIELEGIGEVGITISVGVSVYPWDAKDIRSLISNSDLALYNVKGKGKNQVALYRDISK